ncbi:helix-turn-helix domain-containing protein [Spirosoma flavus]
MIYRKFDPSAHLAPYVECYYVWENAEPLAKPMLIESPPSAFASMVFNYGDTYRVANDKHQSLVAPPTFLTGQATHQYKLELTGRIGMVGIVFKPAGIASLFGLPMYEFSDERVNLYDLLGAPIRHLYAQILEATNPLARVRLLEQFLNRQLLKVDNPFDRIDYTANLIVTQKGLVNVGGLMDELYVCRRQFERQFLQKVGVSPKYYARVRRIGYLCAELATKRWQVADWQDLIFQYGFYDQSHFIRDFTQFTGKKPTLYVKNNVELSKFLS